MKAMSDTSPPEVPTDSALSVESLDTPQATEVSVGTDAAYVVIGRPAS